jgi:hypothetical protein
MELLLQDALEIKIKAWYRAWEFLQTCGCNGGIERLAASD